MEAYLYRENHKTWSVLARMRGAAALLIAVVVVTLLFYTLNVQRECYVPDTGVDWIRAAWESLDPADAIDVDIIIDRDGAKEGKYTFVQDPKKLRVYKDMLQGSGVDAAFIRLDTSDADSRASIVINPRSPFYNALANMDDYSSRYEKDLLPLRPWYLSSSLPVAFADLSGPIIKDTYVTRDGLAIWTIRPEVSAEPSRYARDVLSLLSYAYLLSKVHSYHVDLDTINDTQAGENAATQEVMAGLDQNSRDVKSTLDSQAESVRNGMYDADQKNLETVTNLSREAAEKKRKAFSNSQQAQKAHGKAEASLSQADNQVKSNMNISNAIADLKNAESGEMAKALQTSSMAATILADAEAAIAKNDDLIAHYQDEKKTLDEQSSSLTSRISALKDEISYWRDPARLTMYTNELLAADEVLRQATQTLKEVQLEKDDLSLQLDIAQKREAKLQQQLSDARRNVTDAEDLQSQATKDLAKATGRLQATNDFLRANDALQEDLREAKVKQDSLQDEITGVNAKITNTQTMLAMGRNPDDINKMLDDTLATLGSLKAEYQALSGNGAIKPWEGEPDPTSADLSGKFDLSAGGYTYQISTSASRVVDDGIVWFDEMVDKRFKPMLSNVTRIPVADDSIANDTCRKRCAADSTCWAYTWSNPDYGDSICYLGTKAEADAPLEDTLAFAGKYISRKVSSRADYVPPVEKTTTILPSNDGSIKMALAGGGGLKKDSDTTIRSKSGTDISIVLSQPENIYHKNEGYVALQEGSNALRHFNGTVFSAPFEGNNWDFAWKLFQSGGGYKIFTPYQSSWLAYDANADKLYIDSDANKAISWQMTPAPQPAFVTSTKISLPGGWTLKKSSDNKIHLGTGAEITVVFARPSNLYQKADGYVAIQEAGNALRHFAGTLFTAPFEGSNWDFAWKLYQSGVGYKIFTPYQNSWLAYDATNDRVYIDADPNKAVSWVVTPAPLQDWVSTALPTTVTSTQAPPKVAPFTALTTMNWSEFATNGGYAGREARYLDRHTAKCTGPMNEFKVNANNGNNTMQYQWTCAQGGQLDMMPKIASTPLNDMGPSGGKVAYLDRHNVDCGPDAVLSSIKVNTAGNLWNYEYGCLRSTVPMQCRDVTTAWNDIGSGEGEAIYLDRHDLKCASDEALARFKFERSDDKRNMRYSYRCCKSDTSQSSSGPAAAPASKPAFEWGPIEYGTDLNGMKSYANATFGSGDDVNGVALNKCQQKCESDPRCGVFVWENPNTGDSKCWLGETKDAILPRKADGRKTTRQLVARN